MDYLRAEAAIIKGTLQMNWPAVSRLLPGWLRSEQIIACAKIRPASAPDLYEDGDLMTIFEKYRAELILQFFRNAKSLPPECQTCQINDCCLGCRSGV